MSKGMGKTEWTGMFREIGLTEEQMWQWHRVFEKKYPDDHAGFLEWLGLSGAEVAEIRKASC